jgi:hypothetical protein
VSSVGGRGVSQRYFGVRVEGCGSAGTDFARGGEGAIAGGGTGTGVAVGVALAEEEAEDDGEDDEGGASEDGALF